jgi:hypothetical protein
MRDRRPGSKDLKLCPCDLLWPTLTVEADHFGRQSERELAVTGSSYVAIVAPIVAFAAMAFWLGLVFYADSHPGSRRKLARQKHPATAPRAAAIRLSADDQVELSPSAGTGDGAVAAPQAGLMAAAPGPS